jgi:uncharacterized protein YndB with AHSA1/START domain
MADIMHLVRIAAPQERVYEALTTTEGIRSWWTRDADLDSRIGGTGTFRFHDGGTVVSFAHRGFEQADEHYAQTTTGWGVYLQRLKDYLEK